MRRGSGTVPQQIAALARITSPEASQDGECWEWPGARNSKGYGHVAASLRFMSTPTASRNVVAMLRGAPLAPDEHVLHRCDNPPCFRPSHLFIGTNAENMRDRAAKGRGADSRNDRAAWARLTNDQVAEIRRLRSEGALLRELAERFSVGEPHISRICRGVRRPAEVEQAS